MHGCDMALWRAGRERSGSEILGAQGLALCAAGGLPCVAEEHPLSREVAAIYPAVRLVPRADTVAIGRVIFETIDAARAAPQRVPAPPASLADWRSRMERNLLRAPGADAPHPLPVGATA